MTSQERHVLDTIVSHTCPAGPPENVHLNLSYLERLVSLSRDEIISMFSRLDSLNLITRVYDAPHQQDEDVLTGSREIIEVTWKPLFQAYFEKVNVTDIVIGIFECISNHLCEDCAKEAIERVDLSVLGTLTGFSEK